MPKVSVIIPCFNVEKYIGECLSSLINQSVGVENIELIVVDDKSTDNTVCILKEYEEKYSENMLLIGLEEHLGFPGAVRNVGLQYASGDFVTFVDSDDVVSSLYIEKLLNAALSKESDIASCGYRIFEEKNAQAEYNALAEYNIQEDNLEDMIYDLSDRNYLTKLLLAEGVRTSVWGRIYRTEFIRNNNLFFPEDLHIAEDMFFWHNCILAAEKTCSISDTLYDYRIKSNSLFHGSKNFSMDIVNCCMALSEMYRDKIRDDNVLKAWEAVVYIKCIKELFLYLDAHETTDEMFLDVVSKLRSMLRTYYPDMINNGYLLGENKDILRMLLG